MTVDIDNLLTLPVKERRKIAERLWNSLSPANSISKEEDEIIALLEKRWQNIQSGKSKTYTSAELKKMIEEERNKKKQCACA
ncbi:MAG: addiction module protein [Parafilimonas sp.]